MAQDRLNPALRWFAAICVVGFIFSVGLRYVLPHDLHPAKSAGVDAAMVPAESVLGSPTSQPSREAAPVPVSQPPAAQQVVTVQPADADLLPRHPDRPQTDSLPARPPEPARPLEKVSACVTGDSELRDLFATDLRQSMTGKIVSGNCSSVEGPIVTVSGVASRLVTSDPACRTVDGHLYEVFVSISQPGSNSAISRTVFATRCASRTRNEDMVLGREAKNQAIVQGIASLRGLLQRLSEN